MKQLKLNKKWFGLLIILILVIGGFCRLFQLGQVPAGLTWDEVAIGYNGWSIWQTRRDEWLYRLPVSFKSFGDYKAPLPIYLNGLFTTIWDMQPWTVRLPFALSGIVTLMVWYWLLKQITSPDELNFDHKLGLIFGLLALALSPTMIHFSRVGFESGMATTLTILGLATVYWFFNHKITPVRYLYLITGALCLVAGLYTYHSAKIGLPLILLFLPIGFGWYKKPYFKHYLVLICLIFVLAIPVIKDSIWGSGLTRASLSGVTIFGQNMKPVAVVGLLIKNLWLHLEPQFLLFGQLTNVRHSALTGFLTWSVAGLFYLSLLLLPVKNLGRKIYSSPYVKLGWILVVAGLLPAIIGIEVPHPNRALLALPGFILIATGCLVVILNRLEKWRHGWGRSIGVLITILTCLVNFWQIEVYFKNYNNLSVTEFNQGYLEAVAVARNYELGVKGRPQVGQIIFDSHYGQPYIFTLFGNRINPLQYHNGALVKYLFVDKIDVGDLSRKNTLLVATNQTELSPDQAETIIKGSDGRLQFMLYYLPP